MLSLESINKVCPIIDDQSKMADLFQLLQNVVQGYIRELGRDTTSTDRAKNVLEAIKNAATPEARQIVLRNIADGLVAYNPEGVHSSSSCLANKLKTEITKFFGFDWATKEACEADVRASTQWATTTQGGQELLDGLVRQIAILAAVENFPALDSKDVKRALLTTIENYVTKFQTGPNPTMQAMAQSAIVNCMPCAGFFHGETGRQRAQKFQDALNSKDFDFDDFVRSVLGESDRSSLVKMLAQTLCNQLGLKNPADGLSHNVCATRLSDWLSYHTVISHKSD